METCSGSEHQSGQMWNAEVTFESKLDFKLD
jgi:hypothetical protein